MKKANGTVFKYGDNVDTDVIIPARYLNSSDPAELAQHCMEDIDKDFIKNVKPGDIIVADKNFGCGSSREHAPIAIKAAGVSCVIAQTFARIFYRNAINIGLPIIENARRRQKQFRRVMRSKSISIPVSSPTRRRTGSSKDRRFRPSCRRLSLQAD